MQKLSAASEGSNPPKISVVLSVYNGSYYLREAINSILAQTFTDFELIIVDDGSTDDSAAIILSYSDSRIRLVRNEQNLGLTISLNRAFHLTQGEYIARMDADDLCAPSRLARQIDFLEANPEICVCGCWVKTSLEGRDVSVDRYPQKHEDIKCLLLFDSALAHPAVMIRKQILAHAQFWYDESFFAAQDYELWVRLSHLGKLANIPATLLTRRLHPGQITKTRSESQQKTRRRIYYQQLRELGIVATDKEQRVHEALQNFRFGRRQMLLCDAQDWLCNLLQKNRQKIVYEEDAFARLCGQRWYLICDSATDFGLSVWREFNSSSLPAAGDLLLRQRFRLFVKCLLQWDTQGCGRFWQRIGLFRRVFS